MTWLTAALAVCAVYRAGRMVAEEDGPWLIFKRLRDRYTDPKSALALGLRCFYCISFWAALPVTVLLVIVGGWDVWLWPVWWLGLAGAACKVYEWWRPR